MAFEDGGSKKDRFADRKQARRAKQRAQDEVFKPEPPKGYSAGGQVKGMGAARRGGKFIVS